MKRLCLLALVLGMLGSMAGAARASVYTWAPNPFDLGDLDHSTFYTWGIGTVTDSNTPDTQMLGLLNDLGNGQTIVGATLSFKGINDTTVEEDNLYMHLLDDTPIGTVQGNDEDGDGDNFLGQGVLVGDWDDPYGDFMHQIDLNIDFTPDEIATLLGYISSINDNMVFGIGLDPDCRYVDHGISFTITTDAAPHEPTVPEPATLSLMGIGLGVGGFLRRRRAARA